MVSLLSRLFGFHDNRKEPRFERPIAPAPDTETIPAPSESYASTLQPLKNWCHPFKGKGDPLQRLTHLAKANAGYYPIGRNGLFHGGVHFDSGTAGTLDQSSVHCLADGEVVAYRIDTKSPTTGYFVKETVEKPFSRNFVLVRHRLQPPKIDGSTDIPPSLTFYSLYLHLQDWAKYQQDSTIARPAFWPERRTFRVKQTANDMLSGQPEQRGLSVLNRWHGQVIDFLPRGAEVTISGTGEFRKLESSLGPATLLNPDGSIKGYLSTRVLRHPNLEKTRISSTKKLVNVRAEPVISDPDNVIFNLAAESEVTVSGEGEFRKLERINQYVHFDSLDGAIEPLATDQVVVLDEPVAIKAGDLIGHLGLYQDGDANQPEKKLHLETFSGDDVEAFIDASRAWAQRLPEKDRTWLKFAKGTPVVAPEGNTTAALLQVSSASSPLSAADLLVPKKLLDDLPADRKIQVPATPTRKARTWYRLENLLHDADNRLLDGWVCEETGVTSWVSPWAWEGYGVIIDYSRPKHLLASFLSAINGFSDAQRERYRPIAEKDDKGPMKSRLYAIIDRNRDGKMTATELQAALERPAHAQSIAQMILYKESEWFHQPKVWDALDDLLGHSGSTPHLHWLAEKQRIAQLGWWRDVAEKVGLPSWGSAYHFHPIGLVGHFSSTESLALSSVQLKKIFPLASASDIEVVVGEINGRLTEFKLDTRLRQCHFFAQIKGEVGPSMKGVSESWEYSPGTLKSFSSYYRTHPEEAEEDGYAKNTHGIIVRRANQRRIGVRHFQRLNGNRTSHPDDGYNFRGRGLIQITGYEKYHNFMVDYGRYWDGSVPDTVENPDLINNPSTAIRSALWFWLKYKVYSAERGLGLEDVKRVTKVVNGGSMGLEEREAAFKLIEGVLA